MTNLRLPGQYDERLLGSFGLQGPYYNWNRWYLPGLGRYSELDPILVRPRTASIVSTMARTAFGRSLESDAGSFYGYAGANSLGYVDPLGLDRYAPCNDPDYGFVRRWVCRQGVDWRCRASPGEHAICCQADRADCDTAANGDSDALAVCLANYLQCLAESRNNDGERSGQCRQ